MRPRTGHWQGTACDRRGTSVVSMVPAPGDTWVIASCPEEVLHVDVVVD
jgi:hypothetical protein